MSRGLEKLRDLDRLLKDRAFVHAIGQAPRAGLLLELGAGGRAFFLKEFFDTLLQRLQPGRVQQPRQNEKSIAIQIRQLFTA